MDNKKNEVNAEQSIQYAHNSAKRNNNNTAYGEKTNINGVAKVLMLFAAFFVILIILGSLSGASARSNKESYEEYEATVISNDYQNSDNICNK